MTLMISIKFYGPLLLILAGLWYCHKSFVRLGLLVCFLWFGLALALDVYARETCIGDALKGYVGCTGVWARWGLEPPESFVFLTTIIYVFCSYWLLAGALYIEFRRRELLAKWPPRIIMGVLLLMPFFTMS